MNVAPRRPGTPKRVQRGGSFLCSDQYWTKLLPHAGFFDGSILPEIAGSPSSGELESQLKPTPDVSNDLKVG
jgi:hypothetical protein